MLKVATSERNKKPILNVLKLLFNNTKSTRVLEIASGTGQHVSYFASYFSNIIWQPTEVDDQYLKSIDSYTSYHELKNVKPALKVDITRPVEEWPITIFDEGNYYDWIFCSNMTHITPWVCTKGLFASASRLLHSNSLLIFYGPFSINGKLEPQSNIIFDRSLKASNPEWGIRDTQALDKLALNYDFQFQKMFDMPANNKILLYLKL